MIGANNPLATKFSLCLLTKNRATMSARIVKSLEFAALVPEQQDLLGSEVEDAKGPWAVEFAGPADVDPISVPDTLQLQRVVVWIEIETGREGGLHPAESGVFLVSLVRLRHDSLGSPGPCPGARPHRTASPEATE